MKRSMLARGVSGGISVGTTVVPDHRPISSLKMSGSPVRQSSSSDRVQMRLVHLCTLCHALKDFTIIAAYQL